MTPSEIVMSVIDILLVAFIFYRVFLLMRGTRAWQIFIGIVIFLGVLVLSSKLHLRSLYWVLTQATALGPVALVILFLPELRQTIEELGRLDPWTQKITANETQRAEARTVEEIVAAVSEMSAGRVGALIVIEKAVHLDNFAGNGVLLEAKISAPLLVSIFYEQNPLHDGAVIIRGDLILAAACRLPLSDSNRLDSTLHLRHHAAVGITESVDCMSIVVSEERGTISYCENGRLIKLEGPVELREILNQELRGVSKSPDRPRRQRPKPKQPIAGAKGK
jgi:diadenylate cyclase